MIFVLVLVFGFLALVAAAFVALPTLRSKKETDMAAKGRPWFAAAAGLATMLVGLGAYAVLGRPEVAVNSLTGPSPNDYVSLIATLARRMPDRPGDIEGWTLLGRGYLALGNPTQAEKALARAVEIAKAADGSAPPQLLSSYGEAMTEAAGQVTREAEAVFRQVLERDASDLVARLYLGQALAARGDREGALNMWEQVLAEAPPDSPWRGALLNQVVSLRAQLGGPAPNPMAMVQQLADRLQTNPDNLDGWLMLIRAYSVLGDKPKATAALARARDVFAKQGPAQAELTKAAQEFSLN